MQNEITVAKGNQVARLTYGLTGLNLLITTAMVWFVSQNQNLLQLATNRTVLLIEALGMIGISLTFRKIAQENPQIGLILWMLTSSLIGFIISPVIMISNPKNVTTALIMTVGFCGILTLAGFQTKTDMTKFGPKLFWAFLALIIVETVNMFLFHSTGLELIISGVMLIVLGFYFILDTQSIKNARESQAPFTAAVMIGYGLYLDVINIFLRILQILNMLNNNNN